MTSCLMTPQEIGGSLALAGIIFPLMMLAWALLISKGDEQ